MSPAASAIGAPSEAIAAQEPLAERVDQALHDLLGAVGRDLMAAMAVGLRTFLDMCSRAETVRIAMADGPAVLGWAGWREMESRHGLGLITDLLDRAVAAGLAVDAPVRVLAHLILSAVTEAGMLVANAQDPETERAEAEQCILLMISGLLRPVTAPES